MVSVLAFYSDDLSSDPAEVYYFSVKLNSKIQKNENKQKEAGVGLFLKKTYNRGRLGSVDLSATTILHPRVRIPSTLSTLLYSQILCFIVISIGRGTKINKK